MNKEWISIDDDLPRPGEGVIFCTDLGTWVGWLESFNPDEDLSWYSCDESEFIDEVTHWMPYPDPYTEE